MGFGDGVCVGRFLQSIPPFPQSPRNGSQVPSRTEEENPFGDGRCRHGSLPHRVHRQNVEVRGRFQDVNVAVLTREVELAVREHW